MIRILPKECVKEVAERVWSLAQDVDARCYPLVKSAEEFANTLTWALEDDFGRARSYWHGSDLLGVCCLFVDEKERYAQLIALYAWDQFRQVTDSFLSWVGEEYPAYTIDAGIAWENARVAGALVRYGYCIVDDCIELRHALPFGDDAANGDEAVQALSEGSAFGAYAALHDAWFPGLYWNAKRLSETPDGWVILTVRREGEIAGAILVIFGNELAEIYGLHALDAAMACALLKAALIYCSDQEKGARFVLFMAEAADDICVRAALDCGFSQTGRYIGYRKSPVTNKEEQD